MRKSQWIVLYDGPEAVVLKDVGINSLSVTNDAEAVVAAVAPRLESRRLFYFDSMNQLDELQVEANRFKGFSPGAPQEVREVLVRKGLLNEVTA